jgi:hypothetical protein
MAAIIDARRGWVHIKPLRERQEYQVRLDAEGKIPSPVWPDMTMDDLIRLASKGCILTADHAIVRRLREGV